MLFLFIRYTAAVVGNPDESLRPLSSVSITISVPGGVYFIALSMMLTAT